MKAKEFNAKENDWITKRDTNLAFKVVDVPGMGGLCIEFEHCWTPLEILSAMEWQLLTPSAEAVTAESEAIALLKKLRDAMVRGGGFHTISTTGDRWQQEIDELLLPREPSLEDQIDDVLGPILTPLNASNVKTALKRIPAIAALLDKEGAE